MKLLLMITTFPLPFPLSLATNNNQRKQQQQQQQQLAARQVAAGFEEQTSANELSVKIMDDALRAISERVIQGSCSQPSAPKLDKNQNFEKNIPTEKTKREDRPVRKECLERKMTTESSVFDYKDELAIARNLELSRNHSADVDQLLFLRSEGSCLTVSNSSIHSPESPADSSLSTTDSVEHQDECGNAFGERQESEERPKVAEEQEATVVQLQPGDCEQRPESSGNYAEGDEEEFDANKKVELARPEEDQEPLSVDTQPVDDEDFCGTQQASEANLRQLKMSTLEDVSICGQNRHSAEAARRLFGALCRREKRQRQQLCTSRRMMRRGDRRGPTSLGASPTNSDAGGDDSDTGDHFKSSSSNSSDLIEARCSTSRSVIDFGTENGGGDSDCGYIKLVRRCASSAGGSSSSANYGRTLVCSLSPTSLRVSDSNSNTRHGSQLSVETDCRNADNGQAEGDASGASTLYPIDGDEIRQCRLAFRENRRLIERATKLATSCDRQSKSATFNGSLPRKFLLANGNMNGESVSTNRLHWTNSLKRIRPLPNCKRCQQRLYPLDKLELDFTRDTLNIHRNCFRCQICASLLRLETYSAVDSKLYCPAHIKNVLPTR